MEAGRFLIRSALLIERPPHENRLVPLGYGGVASIVVVVVVRQLFSLRQNDLDYQDYTVLAWSGELKEFSFQSTIATDVAGG